MAAVSPRGEAGGSLGMEKLRECVPDFNGTPCRLRSHNVRVFWEGAGELFFVDCHCEGVARGNPLRAGDCFAPLAMTHPEKKGSPEFSKISP